ncbi:MAG: 6-phosphogluconolactonase [Nitrospirae bacterium]|nr:6-phosphogluconolactonase [Nitrospirota bacterium]
MKSPVIKVFPDLEAVSHHAASIFINLSAKSIAEHGRFAAAIPGGSTPKKLFELLALEECKNKIDWSRVHFFWTDERCVPVEANESNFKLAFDLLLSKIPLPAENIHRIKGELPPEDGAQDYEKALENFFGKSGLPVFDLIILGLGKDGHTASLFPGSDALQETKRVAVAIQPVRKNFSNGLNLGKMGNPGIPRITLTLPVLNNASQVIFLVSGSSKADMIKKILGTAAGGKHYPAGLVKPVHGNLLWLMDKKAGDRITT